jgi:hypothetical protein
MARIPMSETIKVSDCPLRKVIAAKVESPPAIPHAIAVDTMTEIPNDWAAEWLSATADGGKQREGNQPSPENGLRKQKLPYPDRFRREDLGKSPRFRSPYHKDQATKEDHHPHGNHDNRKDGLADHGTEYQALDEHAQSDGTEKGKKNGHRGRQTSGDDEPGDQEAAYGNDLSLCKVEEPCAPVDHVEGQGDDGIKSPRQHPGDCILQKQDQREDPCDRL